MREKWQGGAAALATGFERKATGESITMNKRGHLSLSEEEQDERGDDDVIPLIPLFYFIFDIFNNNKIIF